MVELNEAYRMLISICAIILGVCIFFSLIRAIIGPKTADRIVSVNMIGSMAIIIIALMSVYLNESYLLDVAIIYAMISFLAVVVLTKVYMGVERERLEKIAAKEKNAEEVTITEKAYAEKIKEQNIENKEENKEEQQINNTEKGEK